MEIKWSKRSLKRAEEIGDYIARDSITHARLFIDKNINSVERLKRHPVSGQFTPENPALRQIVVKKYRVIYRLRPKTIEIVTIISPGLDSRREIRPKNQILI